MDDYYVNLFFSEEDGGYIADVPDLHACSAFGATPEEALAEVERAKEAWLAAAREVGKTIPLSATDGSSVGRSSEPARRRETADDCDEKAGQEATQCPSDGL